MIFRITWPLSQKAESYRRGSIEKEKEKAQISINQLIEEVKNKRRYPEKDLSQDELDSIVFGLEKEKEEELKALFNEHYEACKRIYTQQALELLLKDLRQRKFLQKAHKEHKEYIRLIQEGRLNRKYKKAMNELESCFEKLSKLHGITEEEILKVFGVKVGDKVVVKNYQSCLNAILKVARFGFTDHPLVKRWVTTYHALGHHRELRRKRIRPEKFSTRHRVKLEKTTKDGVVLENWEFDILSSLENARPMKDKEAKLFIEVLDICEEIFSAYPDDEIEYRWPAMVYHTLKEQRVYTKSWQAFQKWLKTHKLIPPDFPFKKRIKLTQKKQKS